MMSRLKKTLFQMGIFSVINEEELFSMDKKPPKLKCNFKYIKVYLNVFKDGMNSGLEA